MEEYHIITVNDTTIKCFRDGRIHTICKKSNKYGKKGEWIERNVNPNKDGYFHIRISGKNYFAHRLIMMAFVGESDQAVDHINRIKTDNRFENLRYCNRRENGLNRDFVENAKGYYWHHTKWRASIRINNKLITLGRFDTEEDAHQAYLDSKDKHSNEP